MEKKEFSLKKATISFALRFFIIAILVMIIGTIAVIAIWSSSIENVTDEIEAIESIRGLAMGLVVVDIVVALLATFLATRKVGKKFKITNDNFALLKRNIAIVLIIAAIIIFVIHMVIVNAINSLALEDISGVDSLSEVIDEAEEYLSDLGYDEDEFEEGLDALKGFRNSERLYEFSAIVYLVMIPVSYAFLKKKIED